MNRMHRMHRMNGMLWMIRFIWLLEKRLEGNLVIGKLSSEDRCEPSSEDSRIERHFYAPFSQHILAYFSQHFCPDLTCGFNAFFASDTF
jgi:hypothetical protein